MQQYFASQTRNVTLSDLERRVKKLEREVFGTSSKSRQKKAERCGYATVKGFRFWLPGCMGGAVYGDLDHCTCGEE